eukprot:c2079_g1_i1.p1 GENE.c2079_g1_i1~~c2079_g1_i1.p1  ORF type:complete len:410 (+),score=108.14 c2079_g1_i1:128-1357(+)
MSEPTTDTSSTTATTANTSSNGNNNDNTNNNTNTKNNNQGTLSQPQPCLRDDSRKVALITGVTGQDGSYLAELLLEKGYVVHGIKRRASSFNQARVEHLFHDTHEHKSSFFVHYGDMIDASNLMHLVLQIRPCEVYNLAAQSHVKVSFEMPLYTAQVDGVGTMNLLEAIRCVGMASDVKFYQASTSELYGKVQEPTQSESTPFYPRSPYGVAKLMGFWAVKNYREAYQMFACNGILFNHESPRRGETFVTRKITRAVARIKLGLQQCLYLGNLDARRDWGHARDYVRGMWMMLQADTPDDFVLATGENHSVREFCELAFAHVGMGVTWRGHGVEEVGVVGEVHSERVVVRIDPVYFRPSEVEVLLGNPAKAKKELNWEPQISFQELVKEMVACDLLDATKESALKAPIP